MAQPIYSKEEMEDAFRQRHFFARATVQVTRRDSESHVGR